MPLEENIEALTKALNRNSDLLEGLTAKAQSAVEGGSKGKSDDEDEKPKGRGRKPAAAKKEKNPTIAEMKKEAETYLDVEEEDEYNERRQVVRAVADFYDAAKFTEIAAKDRLTAVKIIKMAAAGENVDPEDIQAAVDDIEEGGGEESKPKSRRSDDDV